MPSFGAAPAGPLEGLNAALAEIAGIACSDPALVGEGAVLLLEKVPPAFDSAAVGLHGLKKAC